MRGAGRGGGGGGVLGEGVVPRRVPHWMAQEAKVCFMLLGQGPPVCLDVRVSLLPPHVPGQGPSGAPMLQFPEASGQAVGHVDVWAGEPGNRGGGVCAGNLAHPSHKCHPLRDTQEYFIVSLKTEP